MPLKHDVDIPDRRWPGRLWGQTVETLESGCVELFALTVVFNSSTLLVLWWLMKGCMGQRFCNAVVSIAELVRVKPLEIS